MRLINPNVKVLFCSAPLPPKTEIQEELEYLKFYGVDIRLVDEFVDIQASMNYTPTLDYYKSLEREAKELRSCRMMILSNSWEDISSMRPGRVASHLFAAMFMGCNPPFMGQGLFLAPGTLLAKLKETINDVAVTEKFWHGSEFDFEKVPWKSLYMADGNFYMLGRKNPTGKVLFLVNNHEFETIYLKLSLDNTKFSNVYDLLNGTELLPYNNGVAIEIPPFSYRVVKFSTNKEALSQNGKVPTEKIEKLASELQREQQAAYKGMSRYDIHCRLNGTSYEVVTPSQKILFNLNRGAEAAWYVGGKKVMNTLGCDFFVNKDKSSTMISGVPVKLNSCRIFSDRAECIFSYRVANEGYRELTILKKFTVQRDSGIITVDIEIIPERGFRNFSYRMNNEFALGKSKKNSAAYHLSIAYSHGNITDKNGNTIIFSDKQKTPFDRYIKKYHPLLSDTITAESMISGENVEIKTSIMPEMFFCWRYANAATVEIIYPFAYAVEDPHLIKNWRVKTVFKYQSKSANRK